MVSAKKKRELRSTEGLDFLCQLQDKVFMAV
jgi:hypothetical protein